MTKTTKDLISIMTAGGSVKVPGTLKINDLCDIARAGANHRSRLIVSRANSMKTEDICKIARANPGNVLFELN
ncbi:MAG: hypothetical protein KAI79_14805 [Bacteroidales bacterium]|nr:hypothetical protein [Bacteroidales bacterium]